MSDITMDHYYQLASEVPGNTFVNTEAAGAGNIRSSDIKKKRACYIDRNNDLIQEFHFAHPRTINEINKIQNSHFYCKYLSKLSPPRIYR